MNALAFDPTLLMQDGVRSYSPDVKASGGPQADPALANDPRWAQYADSLRGMGYPEDRVQQMLDERDTADRQEDFRGFLLHDGARSHGGGGPTQTS